jgi:tetratricopeptide (TPR) repeat protein
MARRTVAGILVFITTMILALPAKAQRKPFTQDQVQGMVRSGLGDETGAKAIEQRGIDFSPTEDFLQSLKAAGANEAFLEALRSAKRPQPPGGPSKKPLNQVQVIALLAGQVPSHRVAMLVQELGIDFEPTDDYLQDVRLGGGDDELISALRSAKVTKAAHVDPAAQARQAEIQQHAARGAEFFQNHHYAEAEAEYRAAVRLDPQNSDLHVALSRALNSENELDEGLREAREALRLNPNNDMAHFSEGYSLRRKGDLDGAIAEFREALRLNPKNDMAHVNVGIALASKGDLDGAAAEFREALSLNPKNDAAHVALGVTLGQRGDIDGEIAEEREAVRLNPRNENAHNALGVALASKGDWEGDIAEQHEALRVNPNDEFAHFALGLALEQTRNREEALQEFRAAYELNPKNPTYQQAYERLLQQRNR